MLETVFLYYWSLDLSQCQMFTLFSIAKRIYKNNITVISIEIKIKTLLILN